MTVSWPASEIVRSGATREWVLGERCQRLSWKVKLMVMRAMAGPDEGVEDDHELAHGGERPAAPDRAARPIRGRPPGPRQILPARPAGALPFTARTDSQLRTSALDNALRLTNHGRRGRNRAVLARRAPLPPNMPRRRQDLLARGGAHAREVIVRKLHGGGSIRWPLKAPNRSPDVTLRHPVA
jgi:hypothetical protein